MDSVLRAASHFPRRVHVGHATVAPPPNCPSTPPAAPSTTAHSSTLPLHHLTKPWPSLMANLPLGLHTRPHCGLSLCQTRICLPSLTCFLPASLPHPTRMRWATSLAVNIEMFISKPCPTFASLLFMFAKCTLFPAPRAGSQHAGSLSRASWLGWIGGTLGTSRPCGPRHASACAKDANSYTGNSST
jgi:hypothetical protein